MWKQKDDFFFLLCFWGKQKFEYLFHKSTQINLSEYLFRNCDQKIEAFIYFSERLHMKFLSE